MTPTSLSGAPTDFTIPAAIYFATVPSFSGPLTTYISDGSSLGIYYLTPGAPAPTSCASYWTTSSAGNDLLVCAYPTAASSSQSLIACPLGFDLAVGVTTVNGEELALGRMPTGFFIGTSCYASATIIDGVSYFLAKEGQIEFTTPSVYDFYGTPTSTLATTPAGGVTSYDASTTVDGVKTIGGSGIEVMVTPTPCHKDGCSDHPAPIAAFIWFPFPIPPDFDLSLPSFPKIQFPKLPCIKIFFIHLGDCPKPKVEDPPEHPPTASPSPNSTKSEECENPLTITDCFDAVTVFPTNGTTTMGYSTTSSKTCGKITTCTGVPKTSMSTTTMSTKSCPTPQTITKCFDAVTVSPFNGTTSGTTTSGYSTTSSQTCSLVTTCSGYPTTTMSTTTLTGGSCPIGITISPDDDQGEDGTSTSTCANTATTTVTDIVSLCSTFNVTSGTVTGPSTTCFTSSSLTVTGTCIQPTTTSTIVNNRTCGFGETPSLSVISLTPILANITAPIPTIGTSSSGDSLTRITDLTAAGLAAITNAYNETITGHLSGYCLFTGPASASATVTSSTNISSMITSAPSTSSSSTSLQPATTPYVDEGNLACNRRTDTGNQWFWFSPAQASLAINNFCSGLVAEDPPLVFGPGLCNQYYQDYPQQYSMAGDLHVAMQWVPGDDGCPTTVFDSNLNSTCIERLTDILNNCDLLDPVVNGQNVEFWKQGGSFYRDCMQWYLEPVNMTISPTSYASSDCGSTTPASLTATTTSNPFVCTYGADPGLYTGTAGYCQCPDGSLYPTNPATSPFSTPCGYTTQPATRTTDLGTTKGPDSTTPYSTAPATPQTP
ncbi:hypothetical protein EJ03DRAFT_336291 [Teratosphaeria nubilosa]|uniref:Uncharacterized protein n=1 Tax=Teratosphaeria nubilosa TaxID=161662 RepID=A0A6G1L921_9PEZI|nr:hypothetical protein EJ03DRAFT_336291 [Teratosphaeria nubilosa]